MDLLPLAEFEWKRHPDGFIAAFVSPGGLLRQWIDGPVVWDKPAPSFWPHVWRPADSAPDVESGVADHVMIPATPRAFQPYQPLNEQPGLFRRFAEAISESEILAFTSAFGALTKPTDYSLAPWYESESLERASIDWVAFLTARHIVPAFKYHEWRGAAEKMRAAIALWENVDQRDASARRSLDALVAEGLGDAVRVQPFGGELRAVPTDLLTAMWLQFQVAREERKDFRKCPARQCPVGWFEVTSEHDPQFCSAECRHRAYRDRKSQAKLLHAENVPVARIAKQLNTSQRQVQKWISERRRRSSGSIHPKTR